MNLTWLLKSTTVWTVLTLSSLITTSILLFTPSGLPSLSKRKETLYSHKLNLYNLSMQNIALRDEVRRLNEKDPELMEALVRRIGYDRPGEVVYVFGEQTTRR